MDPIWGRTSVSKRKMKNNSLFTICLLFIFVSHSSAQQNTGYFSVMFYNVENMFDPDNDVIAGDDNFTPEGDLHWTYGRLNKKQLNISKVTLSATGWSSPDIVVFAEIENRIVLEGLINNTPLKNIPYKIIHKESPDHRGIDVGLIYNSETFNPINYEYYPLIVKSDTLNTREILYVSGVCYGKDTIHIFGNHWPSRYSGLLETKAQRISVARLLKSKVDELKEKYNEPKIIVIGDFNDNPEDGSLSKELSALKVEGPFVSENLYNLFYKIDRVNIGSLKYQSQWFLFDQIIVSGSLLSPKNGLFTKPENARILSFPFLLEEDKKYGGLKPYRTYYGYSYNGGFSDHLPILLELTWAD